MKYVELISAKTKMLLGSNLLQFGVLVKYFVRVTIVHISPITLINCVLGIG